MSHPDQTERRVPPLRVPARPLARLGIVALSVAVISGLVPVASGGFVHAARAEAPGSFASLAAIVTPAVVNISSSHVEDEEAGRDIPGLPFALPPGSPFEEFFKPFFENRRGMRPRQRKATSLGSGFIIDPAGYVVTNNHVIERASEILVTTNDGKEHPAKLIGADPQTDLALLKIETRDRLSAVDWGDSDQAHVGDWILAVGNPFGLGGTVTAGIVSARGRNIHEGPFDDFLQIDAAINQGNSGGPAFDMQGRVIGINTAIFSPSGGNIGIGFAIPSNLAKPVLAALREHGKIERGWLGVAIQPVTPEIAKAMGLPEAKGVIVASVEPNSPAARAGLQPGDVITAFDGRDLADMRDLPRLVAGTAPGRAAELSVWRDGSALTLRSEIGLLRPERDEDAAAPALPDGAERQSSATLGVTLLPVNAETRARFNLGRDVKGAVIADLDSDSPLAEAGLRPGDVILRVGNRPVDSPREAESLAAQAAKLENKILALLIDRGGQKRFVAVDLGKN